MPYFYTLLVLFFSLLCVSNMANAQQKFSFSGVGRTILFNDYLGGELKNPANELADTSNVDRTFQSQLRFDLGFQFRPNPNNHVEAVIRMENELGGFYGAATNIELRTLYAAGVFKNAVKYQVGDINFQLSPYTLHNPLEEVNVNEASIFSAYKDIVYYENLYDSLSYRQQGAVIDFALEADKGFEELACKTFLTRQRTNPETFLGGGELTLQQSKYLSLGSRYINYFNLKKTDLSNPSGQLRNGVLSVDAALHYQLKKMRFSFVTETGFANTQYDSIPNAPDNTTDYFYDVALKTQLNMGLTATVGYKDVGADYYAPAAQTRRINHNARPTHFKTIGNDSLAINRPISLYDMIYDQNLYRNTISPDYMGYNPKFGTLAPYGEATPNRRGLYAELNYLEPKQQAISAFANIALMQEIRGEGTSNLRNFMRIQAATTWWFNRLYKGEKTFKSTIGFEYNTTNRQGEAFQTIDLRSTLLEIGLDYELFTNFSLLTGCKFWQAKGNEFQTVLAGFNQPFNYNLYEVNESEMLLAAGVQYNFNRNIYLNAQYNLSAWTNQLNNSQSYTISRFLLVYSMEF